MIHYAPYPSSHALCGVPRGSKGFGAVDPWNVTCPECMALLIERKLADGDDNNEPMANESL